MATQVTTSLPMWLAGCTYDGNAGSDLRNSSITALYYDQGIATGSTIGVLGGVVGGNGLAVSAGTGMTVNVQPGSYVVPNSGTPTAGGYASTLSSSATLTVQTADPTNPRIDIVVANVVDNGNNTSSGLVQIITGSAAPSPSVPGAPANSITLARITVAAGATSITSAMITDVRPFTTTAGGVLVAAKGAVTGYPGQLAYDASSGSFYHNDGTSTPKQAKVLPWAPVVKTVSAPVNGSGSETTVISQTVTTDGRTDLKITYKWPGIISTVGGGITFNVLFQLYIGSSLIDSIYSAEGTADGYTHSGGVWTYYTSSTTGDTPSSGSHTVKVTAQNHQGTFAYQVSAFSSSNIILRIEPVGL